MLNLRKIIYDMIDVNIDELCFCGRGGKFKECHGRAPLMIPYNITQGDLSDIDLLMDIAYQYEYGWGEGKSYFVDPAQAYAWFAVAAQKGDIKALNRFGVFHKAIEMRKKDCFYKATIADLATEEENLGWLSDERIEGIITGNSLAKKYPEITVDIIRQDVNAIRYLGQAGSGF